MRAKLTVLFGALTLISLNAIANVELVPQPERGAYQRAIELAMQSQKVSPECERSLADRFGQIDTEKTHAVWSNKTILSSASEISRVSHIDYYKYLSAYSLYRSIDTNGQPVLRLVFELTNAQGILISKKDFEFISSPDDRLIVGATFREYKRYEVNSGNIRNPNIQHVLMLSSQIVCKMPQTDRRPAPRPPYNSPAQPQNLDANAGGNG